MTSGFRLQPDEELFELTKEMFLEFFGCDTRPSRRCQGGGSWRNIKPETQLRNKLTTDKETLPIGKFKFCFNADGGRGPFLGLDVSNLHSARTEDRERGLLGRLAVRCGRGLVAA